MAISKPNKNRTASGLAKVNSSNTSQLSTAAIFPVDIQGNIVKTEANEAGLFLLNPASWEESKAAKWAQNTVPGQSDPILQWVSSGPRVVSFDALVTRETSDFDDFTLNNNRSKTNVINAATTVFGNIASQFFRTTIPNFREDSTTKTNPRLLDISDTLDYYRSLLYPIYDTNSGVPNRLVSSPPLVVLFTGKTLTRVPFIDRITSNTDVYVVTNLRIKVTKQLPNLAPMEAMVSFQLTQYTIRSLDRNRFLRPSSG